MYTCCKTLALRSVNLRVRVAELEAERDELCAVVEQEVEALVEAARELTDLHYAAFRKDDGSGDGITVIDSDAEYREHFPQWVNMAAALKPWEDL